MASIFITGSADGLGNLCAKSLIELGHDVVLHARNAERGREAIKKTAGEKNVLIGDLTNVEETKNLAHSVNALGTFDVVIHNAGVYQTSAKEILAVNMLAPYILTCMIQKPKRLIYLSSGMHLHGHSKTGNFKTDISRITYSDSKLYVLMLSMAVARKWPQVYSNAVDSGSVPTRMGVRGAPDDLQKGYETQVMLTVSNDDLAKVSGRYFFHQKEIQHNSEANDVTSQEKFVSLCEEITGVHFLNKVQSFLKCK
jgi:NAD(P)-dependent dehydrogenase (short-subunit alcohol dehydrogenase family)